MIFRIYRERRGIALAPTDAGGETIVPAKGLDVFNRWVLDVYDPAEEHALPEGRGSVICALPRATVSVEYGVEPFILTPVETAT